MGSKSSGLYVLSVMDSRYAAIAGRGGKAKSAMWGPWLLLHARMSVIRETFTQHWCEAFTKLLEIGKPFTCDDIIKDMTPYYELERFSSIFVLHEG